MRRARPPLSTLVAALDRGLGLGPSLDLGLISALAMASACHPPPAPPRVADPPPTARVEAPTLASTTTPAILSAHWSRADDPELGGADGLLLVFNVELDAAALQPRAFVISRVDAGPVWPRQAILAPASEDDENRSVLLVGDFGDEQHPPSHVAIGGALFGEDGTSLRGLGAPVMAFSAGAQVVAVEVLPPGPGRCEGSAQLLRTYWSDELRGVEPDDLARVRVRVGDGEPSSPQRFDDHDAAHGEAGQDNVLDLCLAEAAPARTIWVEAGAFVDAAGHASAAIERAVDD